MKRNGYTVVELLVATALLAMVLGVLFSVFSSGIKQGDNTKKDIYLQQEANYIATMLRKTHFNNSQYSLLISNHKIVLNGTTISDKYQYQGKITYDGVDYSLDQPVTIHNSLPVTIVITFTNNNISYTLRTTFSRGV